VTVPAAMGKSGHAPLAYGWRMGCARASLSDSFDARVAAKENARCLKRAFIVM